MTGEPAREFVDSNVLIYAHDSQSGEKGVRARAVLDQLWESGGGCLSLQVLQEFFVVVTRKVARPLDAEITAAHIADLGQWRVHRPAVRDLLGAIEIHRRHRISFWDALILRSAQELGCSVVWSEDLNDGQRFEDIQVRNPFGTDPRPRRRRAQS